MSNNELRRKRYGPPFIQQHLKGSIEKVYPNARVLIIQNYTGLILWEFLYLFKTTAISERQSIGKLSFNSFL
ncbi:hypothetical protein ACWF7H_03115 [Peribacillus butanolivorans]